MLCAEAKCSGNVTKYFRVLNHDFYLSLIRDNLELLFKALKYALQFPEHFYSLKDTRLFSSEFVQCYMLIIIQDRAAYADGPSSCVG